MTKSFSFLILTVITGFGLMSMLILFNDTSPTGLAEYGILWPITVSEQAEERLEYGYWQTIEGRKLLTHGRLGVTSREASMRRQLTPKKDPLKANSQITDAFCIKSNGLEGRVFRFEEAEKGYGTNCEWYTDIYGIKSDYLLCCDPFTSINPLPWWRFQ